MTVAAAPPLSTEQPEHNLPEAECSTRTYQYATAKIQKKMTKDNLETIWFCGAHACGQYLLKHKMGQLHCAANHS